MQEASSIKVAELSKLLENTQRFINIALINEISSLCHKMKLQTKEVVDVASTKWNFMKFLPDLLVVIVLQLILFICPINRENLVYHQSTQYFRKNK